MQELFDKIAKGNLGEIKENQDLRKYTTYRVGGIARQIVYPYDIDSLGHIIRYCNDNHIKFNMIGHGSNIIVPHYAFDEPLIKLDYINHLIVTDDYIEVGAGYSLIKLAIQLAKKGVSSLAFASGIPGTVGGAIFMNAGAYKEDMSDYVISVDVLDSEGNIRTITNEDMEFGYRQSVLKQRRDLVVVSAKLKVVKNEIKEVLELIKNRRNRRLESQPLKHPSAGSVFRNPYDQSAWKLVDDCGLRGFSVGGASISEKHTNFIINTGNASFDDVIKLISVIQEKVKEEKNINLLLEQEIVDWK